MSLVRCLLSNRSSINSLIISNLSRPLTSKSDSNKIHVLDGTSFSSNFSRSHYCGELDTKDDGRNVSLCGWVQKTRFKNFLLLRDIQGIVQVVFDDEFLNQGSNRKIVEKLNEESVLSIRGLVRRRPQGQENPKMKTGFVEVKCDSIEILNESRPQLPFEISDFNRPNETIRLKYRYLDLRFKELQQNIILRSNFVQKVREFMKTQNFLDIETPTLFRRTPGGAREFIVPTNKSGQFYCLTQSPQQFKQLLMVAGFERYYQVARCYRDENSKPERQPEFTQIDIEMSFINEKDIMNLIENLVHSCWPFESKPQIPFERMKFDEAFNSYGVDKPDIRFDFKIKNLTSLTTKLKQTGLSRLDNLIKNNSGFNLLAIKIPKENNLISLKQIEKTYKKIFEVTNFLNSSIKETFSFMALRDNESSSLVKFLTQEFSDQIRREMNLGENETLILLGSSCKNKSLEILGKLRLSLADMIDEKNKEINGDKAVLLRDPKIFKFLWVVDFPLFTMNEETGQFESTHHPFTAPINEHLHLVKESRDLENVIGLHYDLVLNGSEVAGGSIRIHNSDLQRHVLENILKEDTSQLEHLIEALSYGAPPHGGIAIGLDRFTAILCGTQNIRNVIAFPKNQAGRDLMSSAPSSVSQEELDFYKIKSVDEKNENKYIAFYQNQQQQQHIIQKIDPKVTLHNSEQKAWTKTPSKRPIEKDADDVFSAQYKAIIDLAIASGPLMSDLFHAMSQTEKEFTQKNIKSFHQDLFYKVAIQNCIKLIGFKINSKEDIDLYTELVTKAIEDAHENAYLNYGGEKIENEKNPKFLGINLDTGFRLHVYAKTIKDRTTKRLNLIKSIGVKDWGASSRSKGGNVRAKGKTRSSSAGLQFPVGRIHRLLRKGDYDERVGAGAPDYLTAVLEYLICSNSRIGFDTSDLAVEMSKINLSWKVIDLKNECKRLKISYSGKKNELVKRLNEYMKKNSSEVVEEVQKSLAEEESVELVDVEIAVPTINNEFNEMEVQDEKN
ncbi:unnamed protein product [Brachionus calyciflorus]|uniref:Aspartyl-tRNA synthetase n=1 Tax=Brachionus calyciflorus TaxID=104777 RepID=A0A814GPE5_9BILA|nr:unnamed protein product [Brachionus calyciflorus]